MVRVSHRGATERPSGRLIAATEIRFSEIIAALSVALDITQGQPEGHCMRSALIGMRLAEVLRLSSADRSALFYALLLKDLGCSSNAAKMAYLFGADDRAVKQTARLIDWTKPGDSIKHCWTQCSPRRFDGRQALEDGGHGPQRTAGSPQNFPGPL